MDTTKLSLFLLHSKLVVCFFIAEKYKIDLYLLGFSVTFGGGRLLNENLKNYH